VNRGLGLDLYSHQADDPADFEGHHRHLYIFLVPLFSSISFATQRKTGIRVNRRIRRIATGVWACAPDDEVIWRAGPVSGYPFDSLSFSSFHSERGRFGTRSELAARNRRRGGIGGLGVKGTGRTRRTGVEGGTRERFSVIVLRPMTDLPITSPPPSSSFLVRHGRAQEGSAGWMTLR
jgi:hypothetical protein